MKINITNNFFRFDIESLTTLFYPNSNVTDFSDGREINITLSDETAAAIFDDNGKNYKSEVRINKSLYDGNRCACKRAVYEVFSEATEKRPPWGLLTGINPVTLYLKILSLHGKSGEEVFENEYLVMPEKIGLCRKIVEMRTKKISALTEKSYSIYISIPFCPSRCKYCSFVSASTEREKKYLQPYLETLCNEISEKSENLPHKKPTSIYIGGGTPTVLDNEQLTKLLSTINNSFDLSDCAEFTVEAGRPETITEEKLKIMKHFCVSRVSVNPQSLSDNVLKNVGRNHTVEQFFDAFAMAKNAGFDINVDFIAGLPLETEESFAEGLLNVIGLAPENITIHSLYIKRAADFGLDKIKASETDSKKAGNMMENACQILNKSGYFPYYLYRQKNTLGNNENIGFSKIGKECAYNIYMMDDIQTVHSFGANAMTKIVENKTVKRINHTKFAYNYIKERQVKI